jgi:hypothetical protein
LKLRGVPYYYCEKSFTIKKNKMKQYINSIRKGLKQIFASLVLLSISSFSAYSQQMPAMKMDTAISKEKEIKNMQSHAMMPMPFRTHMGVPLNVGSYALRTSVFPTQTDGNLITEYNIQFMTGITKNVGMLIETEGTFHSNPAFEIMFQFAVLKSKDGMSGISSIIEFEISTEKAVRRITTLVGFSTALVKSRFAFNQAFHYDPREDFTDGSAALVYELTKKLYFVVEISGKAIFNQKAIFNSLAGVKLRISKDFLLGIGYRFPLTREKDFTSQYIVQSDMGWKK